MDVCVFGETVTLLSRSVEHLHVSQVFPQVAPHRLGVGGVVFGAAADRAIGVEPEERER